MDRTKFLAAAAKASEIKLRCDAAFAALRTFGESAQFHNRRASDLERHIAEIRNAPAMRGRLDLRANMRGEIARLERERLEALQERDIARRLSNEIADEAQRQSHQRDSTQDALKRLRVECDRDAKVTWPDGNVDEYSPDEKRLPTFDTKGALR